jgi:uridine kinase
VTPFVLGIAGGTASGKSTIAAALAEILGDRALLLVHDRYYRSLPDALRTNPLGYNFDHPEALETNRLIADIDALTQGGRAALPIYDFPQHARSDDEEHVDARPILIVEGILVLDDPSLRSRYHATAYVECPDDVRLIRRIRRDIQKRGRTVEGVLGQWERTVRPMHVAYVAPSRAHAQVVLDGEGDIRDSVARLLSLLPDPV